MIDPKDIERAERFIQSLSRETIGSIIVKERGENLDNIFKILSLVSQLQEENIDLKKQMEERRAVERTKIKKLIVPFMKKCFDVGMETMNKNIDEKGKFKEKRVTVDMTKIQDDLANAIIAGQEGE